jgi:hypothetical protein
MNLNDHDYERIERYLLQEMDAAERQAFEADCQAQPALAEALQKEKQVHLLIRIHNQSLIRQQVRNLDTAQKAHKASSSPTPTPPLFFRSPVILLAGSIAAVLLVSIGFFWQLNGDWEKGLFGGTRGESSVLHPILDSLQVAESKADWVRVERLYADLPDSLQRNLSPMLQLARAKYQLGKYAEANALASKVMGPPEAAVEGIRCKAKLLLVLTYRKEGRLKEAKDLIGIVTKDNWDCLDDVQRQKLRDIATELP